MGKIIRTIQGRLAAFNAQSEMPDELRQLLRSIDGKCDQQELKNRQAARGDIPAQLQQLMTMGLIQEEADSRINETAYAQDSAAYLPTIPASLTQNSLAKISPARAIDHRNQKKLRRQFELLAQCKSDMETFLLMHAPHVALALLREIENISTLDQLKASISAYEQMIKPTGCLGWTHLAQLRELLAHDT